MSDLLKKWAILSFALFWWATWANCSWSIFCHEQPERFTHISLNKEGNCQFILENLQKNFIKMYKKYDFIQICWVNRLFFVSKRVNEQFAHKKPSDLLICSFMMSDLSESLTVALLSWVTWAICSWSLFCHERLEQFAHSCSFVLSDLSETLTVTH